MDIKEFADKFIKAEDQALLEGNFDALEQLELPDIVIHMPPVPDFTGFEAHKQYIMNIRESISDIQIEWDYVTGGKNSKEQPE